MSERRQVPRYIFGASARLYGEKGEAGLNVFVHVLGARGCMMEGATGLAIGKKCELVIPWRDEEIVTEARVVWVDEKGKMGLKFTDMDKESARRLADLCVTLKIQPPSGTPATELPPAADVFRAASPPPPDSTVPPSSERILKPGKQFQRRKVPRYNSELPAKISTEKGETAQSVNVVTLSVLGCCVAGPGLPGPGEKAELTLEWKGKQLKVTAEVGWKKQDRAGLRFLATTDAAQETLRNICSSLRLQPLAPIPSQDE